MFLHVTQIYFENCLLIERLRKRKSQNNPLLSCEKEVGDWLEGKPQLDEEPIEVGLGAVDLRIMIREAQDTYRTGH